MACPRCKIVLASKTYENVCVEICSKCSGIWLDSGKIQPILSANDMSFPSALVEKTLREAHTGFSRAELEAVLPCPKCSQPMHALNYDYSSGVIIHVCQRGQGLWFDKDQLAQVQIFMERWNDEEKKNKVKWSAMLKQAQQDEYATLDQQDGGERKGKSALFQMTDAILYEFEKLGR